ncbi:MAG: alkaline phosphatase family protein [Fimbriimonadaceae bacterium]|nr:alkaline phosphatase family protein [Fimbriimonadaceae bacterium]
MLAVSLALALSSANESRIAFSSCLHQDKPMPFWVALRATRPDAFLWLGDNVYADTDDRDKFQAFYDGLGAIPDFQAFREETQYIATWDDHDYGLNDGGASFAARDMANELFDEFWNIPADERANPGVYGVRYLEKGDRRIQVIVLDTRYFRSDLIRVDGAYQPVNEPAATILGEAQWSWLEAILKEPADMRIVMSSIQLVPEDHIYEKWANIPAERQRFFELLKSTKAEGVIVVSGDRHLGEISMMDAGIGYPLYDVTASGLNQSRIDWRLQEPNRHRVMTVNYGNNFGLISVQWGEEDPTVNLQLIGDQGEILATQVLKLSWLRPGRIPPPRG